jgi:hypothetical protein
MRRMMRMTRMRSKCGVAAGRNDLKTFWEMMIGIVMIAVVVWTRDHCSSASQQMGWLLRDERKLW